jgi:aminotransferase
MREFVSEKARTIPPSGIRKFFDIVLTMDDVISLGVGEPDFNTPWSVCEAGIYSIEEGNTSYTSNKGLQPLREALSRHLDFQYGTQYDPNTEIIVTTGYRKRSISRSGQSSIRDEVLIAQPAHVSYPPCVTLAGGTPVAVPCTEKDRFRLNPDTLAERVTKKTKALIINFPNNPTGGSCRKGTSRRLPIS